MTYSKIHQIVHLSKYYPPYRGGIETHVQTLARSQANLGFKVYVICINSFGKSGSFSKKTVQEIDQNVTVIHVARWASIAKLDICLGIAKEVRNFLGDPNTIFHLHTPNPTMLLALTRVLQPMNLVITHHSDVIKQKILKYGLRPFEYLIYSRSRQILTTNPEYIRGSKFLQFCEKKLDYLPLSLESFDYVNPNPEAIAYSRQLKETYSEPIWLAVGRLVYYKAFHIAIEAQKYTQGKLMIIGIGSLENKLKTLAQKLGVEDRVIWLGSLSQAELIGAYHAATALWFPSNLRSEGFGLVQVEAMARGCPVINAAIPCSGVSWVSRHEQEALTIPLNDPVALGEAANRLLQEPGLRDRLVIASRDRAKYFDPITMAKRSLEFYEEVLKNEKDKLGTILVTGGAGYIGSHVVLLLIQKGYEVLVLDNLVTGYRDVIESVLRVPLIIGDVGDNRLLQTVFSEHQIDAVLHFAAYAYVGESVANPAIYYRNNTANTLTLLESMMNAGVDKIVFSSTCATYGIPRSLPIAEDHPQQPINPYGKSKMMIEQMLKDFDGAYGLKSVVFRYFNAAGADPGGMLGEQHFPETHLIPLILLGLINNAKPISIFGTNHLTNDGTCIRDYIHVSDLAEAHFLGLQYLLGNGVSEAFNLGNGKGFSVMEVIKTCEKVTGKMVNTILASPRKGDPEILVGDYKKAYGQLGWSPRYSLEEMIEHAWQWHRNCNSNLI